MTWRKHKSPISPHGKLDKFCKKCNRYHTPGAHSSHGSFPKALKEAKKEIRKLERGDPPGKKHRFTEKEDRQARHIAESEEARGYSEKRAAAIGNPTLNTQTRQQHGRLKKRSEEATAWAREMREKRGHGERKEKSGSGEGHQHKLGLTWCPECHALIYKD